MPYILCDFDDGSGGSMTGMIGCISVKSKHKTILIYAFQPSSSAYNLQTTMKFLHSVKSF